MVLESIQEFALTRNFELLCVKNNNLGLYDDLVASTERPGNYLFFVDDANELAELDLILDYTTEKQYGYDVRIIVTVRDYDIDRIKALWQSNNFIKYFDYFLYNFTEVKFYKWRIGSTFKEILTHDSVDSITKQHQQEWLTHIITQNASNDWIYVIFEFVCELEDDTKRSATQTLLENNSDIETFNELSIIPNHWSGWESLILAFQKQIDFLESLYPLVTGMKFINHRTMIKSKVEMLQQRIRNEEIEVIHRNLSM